MLTTYILSHCNISSFYILSGHQQFLTLQLSDFKSDASLYYGRIIEYSSQLLLPYDTMNMNNFVMFARLYQKVILCPSLSLLFALRISLCLSVLLFLILSPSHSICLYLYISLSHSLSFSISLDLFLSHFISFLSDSFPFLFPSLSYSFPPIFFLSLLFV